MQGIYYPAENIGVKIKWKEEDSIIDLKEASAQEKCIKLHALIAGKKQKFLLSQLKAEKSIAEIATKITRINSS